MELRRERGKKGAFHFEGILRVCVCVYSDNPHSSNWLVQQVEERDTLNTIRREILPL